MTTPSLDILGVGSPIVDLLARVEDTFLAGIDGAKGGMELVDADRIERLLASLPSPPTQAPGGSAGNTTFALARLGLRAAFLGKIGNDASGAFYRDSFVREGGDPSRFKQGDVPNGRCLSLITPDSERTLRTDLGAAMTLRPEEILAADFLGCRHAHIEGYLLFNPALLDAVLKAAKAAACTVSLDLASFEVVRAAKDRLPSLLKESVDIVFANEEEAAAFCGPDRSFPEMAAMLADLCPIAVVKLGRKGSLIATQKGESWPIAPIPAAQAIDTTGAGDYWAAGFLYGWLRGKSLAACGQGGSLLGSEIVQVLGAKLPEATWQRLRSQWPC